MNYQEYVQYDAMGLAELVRRREVTAAELVEAALERADAVNGRVNAIVHRFDAQARNAAKALFRKVRSPAFRSSSRIWTGYSPARLSPWDAGLFAIMLLA